MACRFHLVIFYSRVALLLGVLNELADLYLPPLPFLKHFDYRPDLYYCPKNNNLETLLSTNLDGLTSQLASLFDLSWVFFCRML